MYLGMPTYCFFVSGISAKHAVISPPTWYRFCVGRPPKGPLASLMDSLREMAAAVERIDRRFAKVREE